MYRLRIIVLFFLWAYLFVLAPFFRNVGWDGHNSTVEVTMPEVWARSVQCVARGQPIKLFGLGHTQGKSPGVRNIPGD